LEYRRITTHAELTSGLPVVVGHRGQLQEVLINLIHNAIEAMDTIKDDRRVLRVRADRYDGDAILMAVEDPDRALIRRNWRAFSTRSSRRRRRGGDWDWRFAG
jgi:signal transduction histidine kinase